MMNEGTGENTAAVLAQLVETGQLRREHVYGIPEAPEPEIYPLEPRPLAEGLRQVARDPQPPGLAYGLLMEWAKQRGYFGYASVYNDPDDRTRGGWLPTWPQGLYVSTAITSGGAALKSSLSTPEIIAENTHIAEQLTEQIIVDHEFNPRDVLLSTDLPHVKGWKQSDYLIFWLMSMEGVPLDICVPFATELQQHVAHTKMDNKAASYDEKWAGYEQLVNDFYRLASGCAVYRRNDYNLQVAGVRQLVQLVDTERSLGCRAEALYAGMRGIQVLTFELCTNALEPSLREHIGELAAAGARIGRPATKPTRLVSANDNSVGNS